MDDDHRPHRGGERLAVYEREREELAAAIIKAVNGQYIGKPPPLLTGWQERAVSAVLAAGWLPSAAVQERLDVETAVLRAEVADHARAAGIDEDTKAELAAENIKLRAEVARLRSDAADTLANQTAFKSISMEVEAAGEFERYVFTVQRAGKTTPHEARRRAEAELEQLRARLAELDASDG